MADIQRYLNNITAHHRNKPRFNAWLSANLEVVDGVCQTAQALCGHFTLDEARGPQLDVLGELVDVRRSLPEAFRNSDIGQLDDSAYRQMIRAKIVKNQWDGTREGMSGIWNTTLGHEVQADYFDHQNMSMTATLTGDFEPQYAELILRGYVVPKPAGVQTQLVLATPAAGDITTPVGCGVYATYVNYKVQTCEED